MRNHQSYLLKQGCKMVRAHSKLRALLCEFPFSLLLYNFLIYFGMKHLSSQETNLSSIKSISLLSPNAELENSEICLSVSLKDSQNQNCSSNCLSSQIFVWFQQNNILPGNPETLVEDYQRKQRQTIKQSYSQCISQSLNLKGSTLMSRRIGKNLSVGVNQV